MESVVYLWEKKGLFLLLLKRILAGNAMLSRKHRDQISSLPCAAFRSMKGGFGMQGLGAP